MKAFLSACAAAILIAIVASFVLDAVGSNSANTYATSSTRL